MRCFRVALSVLAAGLLAACAPTAVPPPAGLDLADTALANGAPQLALNVAASALEQHPGDPQALLREGRAYIALRQDANAEAALRRAVAADPRFVPALNELGRLVLFSNPDQAQGIFARALAVEPRNTQALNDQGVALDLLRRHTEAQDRYRQALGVDHDMVAAQVNLGLSLAMSGDAAAALRLIQPLAQGSASTPRIRRDLALLLARAGHDREAVQILQSDMSADDAGHIVERYRSLGTDDPTRFMSGS